MAVFICIKFYWICLSLQQNVMATEAEYAADTLASCRPTYKFLLLALALYMAWSCFVPQLLESPHCFCIKTTRKLQQIQKKRHQQQTIIKSINWEYNARILGHARKKPFTWCTRKANFTPWTINSSSSGPPSTFSSSADTLLMYFMANFTDASLIWNHQCTQLLDSIS